MKYKIRKAESKDISDLRSLFVDLLGHELSEADVVNRLKMIEDSLIDELYIYEQENKIQGVLGFRIRENVEESSRYGEISVIVTKPETRKLGIGRALMDFAERRAKELGCKGTWLVSGFGREEEAHKFYIKLGYQITGYRFVKSF
jgi:N-acetylglutamate synthase-like GNAT family acetyltransferase